MLDRANLNFFRQPILPNPSCDDRFCRKNQQIYQEKKANEQPKEVVNKVEEVVKHEDNDWGNLYGSLHRS